MGVLEALGVDAAGGLLVGEAVVVLEMLFEAGEFGLERGDEDRVRWVVVNVAEFFWVVFQIVEFPLIFFPKVDQFVGFGADAVVGAGVVMAGIVVVAVVHGFAPVVRNFAFEEGDEAAALDVGGDFDAGE